MSVTERGPPASLRSASLAVLSLSRTWASRSCPTVYAPPPPGSLGASVARPIRKSHGSSRTVSPSPIVPASTWRSRAMAIGSLYTLARKNGWSPRVAAPWPVSRWMTAAPTSPSSSAASAAISDWSA
ncbi:MAG TPA: hypothetical protein VFM44_02100 [Gemmatimonadota bacterium]|nr:hypothetical protein [Gemmatimonadota bacterium]